MKARIIDEVSNKVTILGREYPLKLSVRAMEEIKSKFGDVETAANGLLSDDTFAQLRIATALVAILATQGARAWNYEHPDQPPIPDLTEEVAETVLTISDLLNLTPNLYAAMNEGMGREVFSMEDDSSKN